MSTSPIALTRIFLVWLGVVSSVLATTVRPPVLNDLVTLTDMAMAGTVTAVRSEWRESEAGRFIHTIVTFRVDDLIIGDATQAAEIELDFLGGTIGERSMLVIGQPRFAIGDRELIFVAHNGRQVSPLVRMGYGRFRLVPEKDRPQALFVHRDDYQPLRDIADVARPLEHHTDHHDSTLSASETESLALTYQAFRQQIVHLAQTRGRTVHHPRLR